MSTFINYDRTQVRQLISRSRDPYEDPVVLRQRAVLDRNHTAYCCGAVGNKHAHARRLLAFFDLHATRIEDSVVLDFPDRKTFRREWTARRAEHDVYHPRR